jgi:hypothetical protein
MKLGVSYNVFDGEELLEGSINQIRSEVDYISVVYQTISNFGDKCDENLIKHLEDLKSKGLVNEIYEFFPSSFNGSSNEKSKRNIGLNLSKNNGCTHHMSMDTDEYYDLEQFKYLKRIMVEGNFDSSACQMMTYYKEPIYRLEPKEEYFVSLIFKIRDGIEFNSVGFPVVVDPTRRMVCGNFKKFTRSEIEMHHMSYVRKNINKKMNNSSAKGNFQGAIPMLTEYFNKWQFGKKALMPGKPPREYDIIKTENKFDIKL